MTCCSIQPRERTFVKDCGFLSFAKMLLKNGGKDLSKNLSSKSNQKRLNHAKQSVTDALKTASVRTIQKTSKAISDLIGNKIANKITKVLKK